MRENNERKKEQINNIVDSPRLNTLYQKKVVSPYFIVLVIVVVLFMTWLFLPFDISERETILVSIMGSVLSSLIILFLNLNNEEREALIKAKKSATILTESLDFIGMQTIQIRNGSRHQIYYPKNWIEYYVDCAIYLEYDYLEVLYSEFNFAEKINNCLDSEDELQRIIEQRRGQIKKSTQSFNVFEVRLNLRWFAMGKAESKPWNQSENYKLFSDYFNRCYKKDVLNLTEAFLERYGKNDTGKVQNYIMKQLRTDTNFLKEEFKEYRESDRAILNEIFKIFLELDKNSAPFDLIWGELIPKNTQEESNSASQKNL